MSAEDREGYKELRGNVHSVFELIKRSRQHTWVRDLLTRRKYAVEGAEETDHIDAGTLFNSRLFTHGGKVYFSNYLVPHPEPVRKSIRAEARKVRKTKADHKSFVMQLVLFQSRWDQYRQMELKNIYRFSA